MNLKHKINTDVITFDYVDRSKLDNIYSDLDKEEAEAIDRLIDMMANKRNEEQK